MKQLLRYKIIAFVLLLLLAAMWIYPLLWGFFTSFKSTMEIRSVMRSFLPIDWTIENYATLLINNPSSPLLTWFTNSFIISLSHTALVLVVVSLAAYGYARLNFKGRGVIFALLLGSMMIPQVVNLVPLFSIVHRLGWVNSFLAVVIPGLGGVFNVFLVRQFILGIPVTFDESARVDGANELHIFFFIILPMIKPALMVVALFSFTGSWNDFLWPSVVLTGINRLPITPGLQLIQGQYIIQPEIATAGAIIAIVPALILFIVAQRYFMQSMSLSSGVKE